MDNKQEFQKNWPQISGPNIKNDLSYANKSPDFDQLENPVHLLSLYAQNPSPNLKHEFNTIRKITESPHHHNNSSGVQKDYSHLNRYSDILPFKHSIVQTEFDQKDTTPFNYINANYITTVFGEKNLIIGAQGPLENDLDIFYRMMWVNDVRLIVMLCQLQNKSGVQCAKYWPSQEENYGEFKVTVQKSPFLIGDKMNQTDFIITHKGQTKIFSHILWAGWPDYGVPNIKNIREMEILSEMMIKNCEKKYPTIVHCSAGIGRTGTMISCFQVQRIFQFYQQYIQSELKKGQQFDEGNQYDYNHQVIKNKDLVISIFSLVRRQREDRIQLVMNVDQYGLIYEFARQQITKLLKLKL